MRYAIYFTPPRDHDLTIAAARWLGRDAFTDMPIPATGLGALGAGAQAYYTAAPRRYGFHATLKAPFRLASYCREADLVRALKLFCGQMTPVTLPQLEIGLLDGFFALVPTRQNDRLNNLANQIVAGFDKFRAQASEAELDRRRPDRLSQTELRNLYNWGYPYVFDAFRFHMTLTGHVEDHERSRVEIALKRHFGALPDEGLVIDRLTLFVEREPGAPFEVHSAHAFQIEPARATA